MSGLVRSCVLPGARHDELPAGAYACPTCQRGLVRRLADIETYLSIVTPVPGRSGGGGPVSRQYGSRPPLRLDVVAMLDRRTEINGASGAVYDDGIDDDVVDEIPNIHADLTGWFGVFIEENPEGLEPPTMLWTGCALLRSRMDWIVTRPWVDEFAADITRVHSALRTACGDAPARAFAHCPQVVDGAVCGGPLVMFDDGSGTQCRACRASWRRDQLLDLMLTITEVTNGGRAAS